MRVHIPIENPLVQSPSDIYKIMQMVLKNEHETDRDKEHSWVLALNQDNKIVNLELVALGTNDRVGVTPAEILAVPLQKQAKGLILVHNHPSGNLEPSEADKDLTDRMIQACKMMNIPLLDHVIITEHSYFSFQEAGLIKRLEGSNKYIPPYELEQMSYQGGRQEREEEIAKQMIKDSEPIEKIKKWTGMSREKIEELIKSAKETI